MSIKLIIGQKSFGKGLIQHPYDLNDSLTLKITTAKFYLPSGRIIQKQDYLNNGFFQIDRKPKANNSFIYLCILSVFGIIWYINGL